MKVIQLAFLLASQQIEGLSCKRTNQYRAKTGSSLESISASREIRANQKLEKDGLMTKESEGKVTSEVRGHILKITISNPAKRNAFDPNMMLQLSNALT